MQSNDSLNFVFIKKLIFACDITDFMGTKKDYIRQKGNSKIKLLEYLLKAMVLVLSIIVLYDSFKHHTPLYYILFYFLGLIIGRIYKRILKIEHDSAGNAFVLKVSRWDVVLTLLLLLFRFYLGGLVLESVQVVWISDALYLIFIGIYRSKWKGIVNQIDEIIYKWVSKN